MLLIRKYGISTRIFHVPRSMAESLGERLRRVKKARGVDNAAIAAAAGVHPKTVSRWLNDKSNPDPSELDAAAEFLGVTSAWLRSGEQRAGHMTVRESSSKYGTTDTRRMLPPRAYERLFGYLDRLEKAGADEEQIDVARRLMADVRYSRLNKGSKSEPSEDDMLTDIDAGWSIVWELATQQGMKISGPRPRFGKAEEGA